MGVDLGSKRIGLAVSDAGGAIAFPAGFLASQGRTRDLQALCEMIDERGVTRVVVEEAHIALLTLLRHYHPAEEWDPFVHPTAVIGNGVRLGEG